jgi:hypothetical protein
MTSLRGPDESLCERIGVVQFAESDGDFGKPASAAAVARPAAAH